MPQRNQGCLHSIRFVGSSPPVSTKDPLSKTLTLTALACTAKPNTNKEALNNTNHRFIRFTSLTLLPTKRMPRCISRYDHLSGKIPNAVRIHLFNKFSSRHHAEQVVSASLPTTSDEASSIPRWKSLILWSSRFLRTGEVSSILTVRRRVAVIGQTGLTHNP